MALARFYFKLAPTPPPTSPPTQHITFPLQPPHPLPPSIYWTEEDSVYHIPCLRYGHHFQDQDQILGYLVGQIENHYSPNFEETRRRTHAMTVAIIRTMRNIRGPNEHCFKGAAAFYHENHVSLQDRISEGDFSVHLAFLIFTCWKKTCLSPPIPGEDTCCYYHEEDITNSPFSFYERGSGRKG
ncbi:hypothetical protein J6590_064764 [Homalodisca vitripennis]|nr:hypothetical protein J6590_064764 [Homalodisca vitripennis]